MAKIASTLILVGVIITVQAAPATYEEILAAAKVGQWDQVQEYSKSESDSSEDWDLNSNLAKNALFQAPSLNNVRELKPSEGGHVYGEAEYSYHSASNINGKKSEDKAGHKVINDDGRVKEFDFIPSTPLPIEHALPVGHDFSAVDYISQYSPTALDTDHNAGYHHNNAYAQPQHYEQNSQKISDPLRNSFTNQTEKDYNTESGPVFIDAPSGSIFKKANKHKIKTTKKLKSLTPKPSFMRASYSNPLDIHYVLDKLDYIVDLAPRDHKPPARVNGVKKKTVYNAETSTTNALLTPSNIQKPRAVADAYYSSDTSIDASEYPSQKLPKTKGKIKVFDITRKTKKSPKVTKKSPVKTFGGHNLKSGPGNVFNEAQYSYSHASSFVNGSPVQLHHASHDYQPNTHKTIIAPISFTDVRDLRPPHGGQVYGEAQYAYHTSSNINGKKTEDHGGHKIINNNGRIEEFDFTPSSKSPIVSY